jgi:PKD repeat protein
MAELNYEVGVAYLMQYGHCGSGAYVSTAEYSLPTFFRYKNTLHQVKRTDTTQAQYSQKIKAEIIAHRPVAYGIYSHAIVADGWRKLDMVDQIHMNYGWAGSQDAWYTIDQTYCPWAGCAPWVESMIIGIEPADECYFTADTSWGRVPFQTALTGFNTVPADSWTWSFGDGDSSFIQSPTHIYTRPGRYTVNLEIQSGAEKYSYKVTEGFMAIADTISVADAVIEPDSKVVVTLSGRNIVALNQIELPIQYAGSLDMIFDSFSTVGCRTNFFTTQSLNTIDPTHKKLAISLNNPPSDTLMLLPDYGPLVKLYFHCSTTVAPADMAIVTIQDFDIFRLLFKGKQFGYTPDILPGNVYAPFLCGDANGDGIINIKDITYLISYLYQSGPEPIPIVAGDVNGNGDLNIKDITYLINRLYRGGPAFHCM